MLHGKFPDAVVEDLPPDQSPDSGDSFVDEPSSQEEPSSQDEPSIQDEPSSQIVQSTQMDPSNQDMPSSQEHNFVRYKITKSRYFPYRKISIRDSEPLISSTFPITRFSKRLLAKSEK
jgi:hypothetical protein